MLSSAATTDRNKNTLIDGPFKIGILEDSNTTGRELHLDFTEDFRALSKERQASALKTHIHHLQKEIQSFPEDSNDRQGMLMIQQVSEQLLPHIAEGEIPLNETIVIELQSGSPLGRFIPQ